MATIHNSFTVGDSTYLIVEKTAGQGRDVTIQNNGSSDVFLGGAETTSNNYGFKLVPGAAISFELDGQDEIFAYCDSVTDVNVLKVNLERTK